MKKDEIKTYEKYMKKYTLKNGELVEIVSLYDGEKVDLDDKHNGLVKDYKGGDYCGNCNGPLSKEDKYCPHCGTKRGEGEFLPFINETLYVYGPPIAYYYKCKKCGHKSKSKAFGNREYLYCPKCGAPNIELTKKEIRRDSVLMKKDSFIHNIIHTITKNKFNFDIIKKLKTRKRSEK